MKLIFCPVCTDVRKLQYRRVYCECQGSWGCYESDGLHARIGGSAVPLGILNDSFTQALRHRPQVGTGPQFIAFVIADESETIEQC